MKLKSEIPKNYSERIRNTLLNKGICCDDTDIAIWQHLAFRGPATVTAIQRAIEHVPRTTIFYRLLTLKGAGLVTSTRTARNKVVYSLSNGMGDDEMVD
ncbi:MAG: helix-turn-helix domain-containing protein [Halobacteriota archaeon]